METARAVCPWALQDPLSRVYHDCEWGNPLHDDRALFELMVLEGMQAGLSWSIILKKREALRRALAGFVPEKLARMTDADIDELMQNPALVRNRRKLSAAVSNARACLALCREWGSLDAYLWHWVGGEPIINRWTASSQVPARTALSEQISRDLQRRGFTFVGPTICYAYMQAIGMVCDHLAGCPGHPDHCGPARCTSG